MRMLSTTLSFGAALALSSAASAATVSFATAGGGRTANQILDFDVTGADMGGLRITAGFADGSTESAVWSGAASGVFTSLFSLSVEGDTYSSIWRLANLASSALTSLLLEGWDAGVVFDRTEPSTSPDFGTPDSRRGRDFTYVGGAPDGEIAVTYSEPVDLADSPGAVGDLFATLNFDLTELGGGGLSSGATLRFRQDTDTAIATIPAPPSLLAVVSALAALMVAARGHAARRRA